MSRPDFSWIQKKEPTASELLGFKEKPKEEKSLKDEILNSVKLQKSYKVGGSDPGRQRDSFGFVGVKYQAPQLLITGAQRWLGHRYLTVEERIAQIHEKFKFDYQVIEVNNTGIHVFEVLKFVKKLPIIGVNTAKDLDLYKQTKKHDQSKFPSMDKNDMARWLHIQNELGNIVFPRELTKELQELQEQITNIVEYKSEGSGTGRVSYRAEGQEHDDLYMALMLAAWFIREHLMRPARTGPLLTAGANYADAYEKEEVSPEDRILDVIKKQMGSHVNVEDVRPADF